MRIFLHLPMPECDISFSKLLGFETFPIFWMVSDSVSKKFGIEKSIRFGIVKNLVLKKVSDSVSEIFGIEKSIGFVMEKNYQKNLGFVGLNHGFLKFGIGIGIGFETFPVFWLVSDSVSKKFGIEKSIGFGIGKIWYRKKYRIRYRKKLVSKKVSDSVSERIWYRKKYRNRYRKYLVSEKRFGFGFVQILGIVTHWFVCFK